MGSGDKMDAQNERSIEARVSQLESLVDELLKESPEEVSIKTKMESLKIPYTSDPVERINRVLQALHPYEALDFEES
jgi:hypothetical protein